MNQLSIKKMNEISKKKKKGFTLVELVIVIAIIAVLAAIAIPKFGAIKKDANIRADQANAKIIATAAASAIADGLTLDTGDVVDAENYIQYIDGKKAPKPKTTGATKFILAYDGAAGGTGVSITIDTTPATTVYPVG